MPADNPGGGVIGGESWIPTAAGETRIFRPSAGVTVRTNVQIQNVTASDLYLADGERPPADPLNAKFLVPAQSTANFPLESNVLAAKWAGIQAAGPTERISLVFTDGPPVVPSVTPGAAPSVLPLSYFFMFSVAAFGAPGSVSLVDQITGAPFTLGPGQTFRCTFAYLSADAITPHDCFIVMGPSTPADPRVLRMTLQGGTVKHVERTDPIQVTNLTLAGKQFFLVNAAGTSNRTEATISGYVVG